MQELKYTQFLGFMSRHIFEWGSTLNRNTVIGVS